MQLQISGWHQQDARVLRKMDGVQLIMTRYTPCVFVWEASSDVDKLCPKLCCQVLMWENAGQEAEIQRGWKSLKGVPLG